ncbi:hypothetical protein B0O99DRAFT_58431 [Bisporella sp. PMI_857]|nr:hypothetical protein B0O99DRAFT_58431 [Bisporella sp. PMI_857]
MTESPTEQDAVALFEALEFKFPHRTLGNDKWYLVALSALVAVNHDHIATLYKYLINKAEYSTSDSRKTLIRRIREALVENISIQGVCKPLEALFGIIQIEREEDKDYSFSRENWSLNPETHKRGKDWLETIYKDSINQIDATLAAHRDIKLINYDITYGFYLSDMSILDPVETELVVLTGIMIQNMGRLTAWHLRGMRRVGVSKEDTETVHQCIEMVAKFGGIALDKVPRVEAIEHEI